MNKATQVLTILNLCLAAAFLVSAMMMYAIGENWKRRWVEDTAKDQQIIKVATQKVTDVTLDYSRSQNALSSASQQNEQVQAANDQLTSKNKVQAAELLAKDLTISQQNSRILAQNERVTDLEESLRLARQRASELNHIAQVARAVAFQLNVKLSETEDDKNSVDTELTKANEKVHQMEEAIQQKDARLALVKRDHPEVWEAVNGGETMGSSVLSGVVSAVRKDPATGEQHLVMLSIGGDDKVEEGTEFVIYRGGQYIVKVRAQKVFPDMVACIIDQKSWNKQGLKVELTDSAQNRLFY